MLRGWWLAGAAGMLAAAVYAADRGPVERRFSFTPRPPALRQLPAASVQPVEVNAALFSADGPTSFTVEFASGVKYTFDRDRLRQSTRAVTWVGRLRGVGKRFRALISKSAAGRIYGRIATPDGAARLESRDGQVWLVETRAAGLQRPPILRPDGRRIPKAPRSENDQPGGAASAPDSGAGSGEPARGQSQPGGLVTVDLIALYTANFGANPPYPNGSWPPQPPPSPDPEGRLQFLVDITNQAYADSGVDLVIRVVHSELSSYTDYNDNDTALSALPPGSTHSVFSHVEGLRTQYGGDLVALLRPFDYSAQGSCGVAWIGGGGAGLIDDTDKPYGYSVTSDGWDVGDLFFCDEYTFAHEVGHNMGNAHQSGSSGVFSYSRGHGVSGTFGSVMSTGYTPVVGMFSTPLLNCPLPGSPNACGTSGRDNVRSMNNVVQGVADYYPTVVTDDCPECVITRNDAAINTLQVEQGGPYTPPQASGTVFDDVGSNDYGADWIEDLAGTDQPERLSCNLPSGNLYCPQMVLTKGAMARLVWHAKHDPSANPPGALGNVFQDVPDTHPDADYIEALWNEGHVQGCDASRYCPQQAVTEQQLGTVLDSTFPP